MNKAILGVAMVALATAAPLSAQVVFRDTFNVANGLDFNGPAGDLNAYGPSVQGFTPRAADLRNINLLPAGRTWQTGRRDTTPSPAPNTSNDFDRTWVYIGTVGSAAPTSWNPSPGYVPPPTTPLVPNGGSISNTTDGVGVWGAMNTWMNIDVSAGGSFFRQPELTVRANLRPNSAPQTTGANAAFFGVGLGYWGSTSPTNTDAPVDGTFTSEAGQDAWTGFTGLTLRSDGRLSLLANGSVLGFISVTTSGGGWTAQPVDGVQRELQYTVSNTTGELVSVTYNGASLTASQLSTLTGGSNTGIFTTARTVRAGLYSAVTSPAGDQYGSFPKADNFEFVPEPSTYAMIAGAVAVAVAVVARRRRAARS